MIKNYAHFSKKHHYIHLGMVSVLMMTIVASMAFLISTENLTFSVGAITPLFPMALMAKASKYKMKYL